VNLPPPTIRALLSYLNSGGATQTHRSLLRRLFTFIYIKMMILPSQARDKRRRSTQKERERLASCFADGSEKVTRPQFVRKLLRYEETSGGGATKTHAISCAMRLYTKNDHFYQDRLGTNIGKRLLALVALVALVQEEEEEEGEGAGACR
jgi:hypothetical protein